MSHSLGQVKMMKNLLLIAVIASASLRASSAFAPIHPCAVSRASKVAGTRPTFLTLAPNEDDDLAAPMEKSQLQSNELGEGGLDAGGFAGYLAPYALAAVASIGVTYAFVTFVLMDY